MYSVISFLYCNNDHFVSFGTREYQSDRVHWTIHSATIGAFALGSRLFHTHSFHVFSAALPRMR